MIRSARTRASARASGALIAPFWEAAKARVADRLMVSVFFGISVNMEPARLTLMMRRGLSG